MGKKLDSVVWVRLRLIDNGSYELDVTDDDASKYLVKGLEYKQVKPILNAIEKVLIKARV